MLYLVQQYYFIIHLLWQCYSLLKLYEYLVFHNRVLPSNHYHYFITETSAQSYTIRYLSSSIIILIFKNYQMYYNLHFDNQISLNTKLQCFIVIHFLSDFTPSNSILLSKNIILWQTDNIAYKLKLRLFCKVYNSVLLTQVSYYGTFWTLTIFIFFPFIFLLFLFFLLDNEEAHDTTVT